MQMAHTRRSFLQAMALGALVGACSRPSDPAPLTGQAAPAASAPTTTSAEALYVPPKCLTLDEYEFAASRQLCPFSELGPPNTSGVDYSWRPLLLHGPLQATDTAVIGSFGGAVLQWGIRSGRVERLLAPWRSDFSPYAHRGDLTVVPACDGTLVVHRDGCIIGELPGHEARPDPRANSIVDIGWSSEATLVSLGRDNTVRTWDPGSLTQLAAAGVSDGPQRLIIDFSSGAVGVCAAASITLFDDRLRTLEVYDKLPPTRDGWQPTPSGHFFALPAESQKLLVFDSAAGALSDVDLDEGPHAIAVGSAAVAVGQRALTRVTAGGIARTELSAPLIEPRLAALSSDETTLVVAVEGDELVAIDARTGEILHGFEMPEYMD